MKGFFDMPLSRVGLDHKDPVVNNAAPPAAQMEFLVQNHWELFCSQNVNDACNKDPARPNTCGDVAESVH